MSTTGEKYFDLLLKTMVLNFAPRAQLAASGDTFIIVTRGGEGCWLLHLVGRGQGCC